MRVGCGLIGFFTLEIHMQSKRTFLALSTAALLGGVAALTPAWAQPATVRVDGSSTVFPISEAVAEEFQRCLLYTSPSPRDS